MQRYSVNFLRLTGLLFVIGVLRDCDACHRVWAGVYRHRAARIRHELCAYPSRSDRAIHTEDTSVCHDLVLVSHSLGHVSFHPCFPRVYLLDIVTPLDHHTYACCQGHSVLNDMCPVWATPA